MRNAFAVAAATALLVSCSGGGTGSPRPVPVPTATVAASARAVSGTLTLTFPRTMPGTIRRGRSFVSPSASSIAIAVTGEPSVVADISASSPDCTPASPAPIASSGASPAPTTRTCSIAVLAPIGSDTFAATLYDGANATGTVLGTGSATQTVTTTFTVTIAVAGVVSSLAVTVSPSAFTIGTAATATVSVAAYDPDGNLITGTYANAITLTDTDSSGTFALSTTAVPNSTTAVSLAYSGAATPASATISASSAGVATASITPQTVTASAPPNIYAAQNENSSVTVTADNANGNAAPLRTISGITTGLSDPSGIAVDRAGLTYVTGLSNSGTEVEQSEVEVFAAGAGANALPQRTIAGDNTDLSEPVSLAVDSSGYLYASNLGRSLVTVYAPGANGNAAYAREIDNTALQGPLGIALDASNALYVVNNGEYGDSQDSVFVFAPGAGDGSNPTRIVVGAATGLANPMADAVDAAGNLYVTNSDSNSVTVYGPSANGDAVPIRTIAGSLTGLAEPLGIALDAAGNTYVGNTQTSSIEVFAAGATGNVLPIRTIAGSATGFSYPFGLTIGP